MKRAKMGSVLNFAPLLGSLTLVEFLETPRSNPMQVLCLQREAQEDSVLPAADSPPASSISPPRRSPARVPRSTRLTIAKRVGESSEGDSPACAELLNLVLVVILIFDTAGQIGNVKSM